MELWIKNQDKTILQKVDNLLISNGINEKKTFNIYTNNINFQNVLGEYKTKERALEVLDEIQNYIIDKNVIYNCNSILTLVNNKSLNDAAEILERVEKTSVYEMPKE
jgi:hypothetical protein